METADGAVGDRGRDCYEGEEPGLRVREALRDLVGFEVFVLDAGLVFSQAFDGRDFFCVRERAGGHGVVGEEEDDDGSHGDCHEADDEEHDLPGAEEGAGVVLEAEGHEGADYRGDANTHVPETDTFGLFVAFVPGEVVRLVPSAVRGISCDFQLTTWM